MICHTSLLWQNRWKEVTTKMNITILHGVTLHLYMPSHTPPLPSSTSPSFPSYLTSFSSVTVNVDVDSSLGGEETRGSNTATAATNNLTLTLITIKRLETMWEERCGGCVEGMWRVEFSSTILTSQGEVSQMPR